MIQKTNPVSIAALCQHIVSMLRYHDHGYGMKALFVTLLTLSVLAGISHNNVPNIYVAGEVAAEDVIADRDIMIEDTEATRIRRAQVESIQPPLFDIDSHNIAKVNAAILRLLDQVKTEERLQDTEVNDIDKNTSVSREYNLQFSTNVPQSDFVLLAQEDVQKYCRQSLLPWIGKTLSLGVLPHLNTLDLDFDTIIIRNLLTESESLRSFEEGILDLRAFRVALKNKILTDNAVNYESQNALIEILPKYLTPTLSPNVNESKERAKHVTLTVDPVFYNISKGEILVRAGDRVTPPAQLKMQTLYNDSHSNFSWLKTLGALLTGLVCMLGLYMTPSGIKGRILKDKDQLFIASVLLTTGIAASLIAHYSNLHNLPYIFPLGGIAGLSVLVFTAKRYCVMGILLSFYVTVLFDAGMEVFCFYFLSSMFSTWVILRTQNRQEVLWTILPFFAFQLIIGFAAAFLSTLSLYQFFYLVLFIAINSVVSILLLFALGPILEVLFGYTTRFRLMELLSLDHPLLQELMMKVPGTYHHALVVSNLVESGAKSIGANSLLIKVAALYHDIGKLARPDYFSENQFDGINPHDKLSPAMSCLILFSHVKHGAELAQQHKLGEEITDMILQHHGTRMPAAFYHKAIKLGETPSEADFSYPGPRPQTKEAAILMMADTVEAAIRSMGDPSPARIRSSVEMLIKNIYAEGQFDETDLTFKDLNKLIDSFARSLTGLHHQRIAYPDSKKVDNKAEQTQSAQPQQAQQATSSTEKTSVEKNASESIEKHADQFKETAQKIKNCDTKTLSKDTESTNIHIAQENFCAQSSLQNTNEANNNKGAQSEPQNQVKPEQK